MKRFVAALILAAFLTAFVPAVSFALEITVFKPGDVNTDNVVDAKDAELLLDYLAGVENAECKRPDINEDGTVDNIDVVLLLKHLAGYEVQLRKDPNEGWTGDY